MFVVMQLWKPGGAACHSIKAFAVSDLYGSVERIAAGACHGAVQRGLLGQFSIDSPRKNRHSLKPPHNHLKLTSRRSANPGAAATFVPDDANPAVC